MKQSRSIIITASLIGAATISMPAKPLLAHSGHSSQEENKVEQPATDDPPSPTLDERSQVQPQISPEDKNLDSQNTAESKQPTLTESEITPTSNPETVTLESTPVNLVPIVGESLFVLLLASPFLLLAFKKWFHK